MIVRPLVRSIRRIVRPIISTITSGAGSFKQGDQAASLVLDFTRSLYGVQSADETIANQMNPLPSLLLDFAANKYFVGGA
ncbi:hypothetical protein PS862_02865 [Pseudomonas fluorescens]|uniref:Uncharacterized protein n=1 Tax=Pseudomonas fluorescens TaxID=294 RepID=A0A5E7KKC5_PSEFL|nr:hypothetical protein [Pseudomonas fluorescens]VVP01376.1 hypothetical protein PS862_02865 [Pseudomonas fluorescens]